MICRYCKTTENLMPKPTSVSKTKSGKIHSYYCCRECNRKRLKKYRATERGAARTSLAVENSILRHPEKQAARYAVLKALRNKILFKPSQCEICQEEVRPEAHHPDYSRPLEVVWACRRCHADIHSKKHKKDVIMSPSL